MHKNAACPRDRSPARDRPERGGAMDPLGRCNREFGMKWRVMLELVGPDGTVAASLAAKYERGTAVITINSN